MAVWKRCVADPSNNPGPALFLDRDGVIMEDRDYLADPDGVELLPGAADAMRAAAAAGFLLIGLSNQSGIGRGMFTQQELARVMERLDEVLAKAGVGFDGFYYCPHTPQDGCGCRKPGTGLLDEAAESCRWDVSRSWVIGDKASDVRLALAGGMGGILVLTGQGPGHWDEVREMAEEGARVLIAEDMPAAFRKLREAERKGPDR